MQFYHSILKKASGELIVQGGSGGNPAGSAALVAVEGPMLQLGQQTGNIPLGPRSCSRATPGSAGTAEAARPTAAIAGPPGSPSSPAPSAPVPACSSELLPPPEHSRAGETPRCWHRPHVLRWLRPICDGSGFRRCPPEVPPALQGAHGEKIHPSLKLVLCRGLCGWWAAASCMGT